MNDRRHSSIARGKHGSRRTSAGLPIWWNERSSLALCNKHKGDPFRNWLKALPKWDR